VARKNLVANIEAFSTKNGDEIGARRQNWAFLDQKRRRERVSSSKKWVFYPKTVTRTSLVVKKVSFLPQSGDEDESRRQNRSFFNQKRWREQASSPKLSIPRPKTVTRSSLVVKIRDFFTQNGDENESRRQNWAFLDQKRWRDWGSSPKLSFFLPKTVTRTGLAAKNKHFSPKSGDEIGFRRQN